MALPEGLAPTLFPQTTGCFSVQLREPKNRNSKMKMVGGAGNAPVVTSDVLFFDTGFTDRQPDRLPRKVRNKLEDRIRRNFRVSDFEF
jgi:hypothetical protein